MNKPRIFVFSLSFWHDAAFARRHDGAWYSHRAWLDRVTRCFKPAQVFLACGSWSSPEFSPIPEVPTVNAGVPYSKPYGPRFQYAKMAFTAAMAYALNRANEWDLLIQSDTEALIGAVDFPRLFAEFMARPETIMANAWCGVISGGVMVFKREGAIRLLHHFPFLNYLDDDEPDMPLNPEQEWCEIFKGRWWNPWKSIVCMNQAQAHGDCTDDIAINWPSLYMPTSEAFAQRYIQNHLTNAVTL